MVVRKPIHVERIPGLLVFRFDNAGENAVPEVNFVNERVRRVIAPHNAYVQHVQVIVRARMHATVAIVMPKRHDHAVQVVVVLRLNEILDIVVYGRERILPGCRLPRLIGQRWQCFDIAWQIVTMPERHE